MNLARDVALALAAAAVVGWVVPAVAVRMLLPALEAAPVKVRNYRGMQIPTGLGIAWLVWAVANMALIAVAEGLDSLIAASGMSVLLLFPTWLALPVFAFGLVDDAFGGAGEKGFRGHLSAIARGRLTTGGLKLVGIGLVAVVVARPPMLGGSASGGAWEFASLLAVWGLGVLVIALCANLVNLTDLRPGRALKAYSALTVIGLALAASGQVESGTLSGAPWWAVFAVRLVLLLGPVAAVWRYDLGERAMLGDAGANVMGALAGYVLASALPLWGLAVAAAVLLGLNLVSEKVSFSRAIEGNAALRWIDGLGRIRDAALSTAPPQREHSDEGASPPDAEVGERDSSTGKDGAN
jgi:hypothetical protein